MYLKQLSCVCKEVTFHVVADSVLAQSGVSKSFEAV